MNCPICGADIDEDKQQIYEKLSKQGGYGYFHLDKWIQCPNPQCHWTPAFGLELEDANPIYWHPQHLPLTSRRNIEAAFHRQYEPHGPLHCPFTHCHAELELHKIYVNTWRELDGEPTPTGPMQFIIPGHKPKEIHRYFVPGGILGQYKCTNPTCKYVCWTTV